MNPLPLHLDELHWIQQLHDAIRAPILDRFFIGMNALDSMGFVFLVVTVVWYLVNQRIGIQLLYILALSAVINRFLKIHFDLPRPCQLSASIGLLCPSSRGFPSGAAQSAIIYAGVLFFECRNWFFRILGIAFAVLLCFSRIYLGVHFFTDIVAGLVVGGGLLFVYKYLFPIFEKNWKEYAFIYPFFVVVIAQKWAVSQCILFIGIFIGLLCRQRFSFSNKCPWMQCISVLIVGSIFIFLTKKYPHLQAIFALLAGVWLSFLGAWIAERIYGRT